MLLQIKTHTLSVDVVLNVPCLFYTGAYSHYCHGAVHQAGTHLISHIIINTKVADKATGPSETKK